LYEPQSPFWFLYVMVFCLIFVHLFLRLGRPVMLALALAAFVLGQYIGIEIVRWTGWGILYFSLGAACAALVRDDRLTRLIRHPLTLVVAAAGTVGTALALNRIGLSNELAFPVVPFGILMMFCLAYQVWRLSLDLPAFGLLGYLGRITLTILVVHIMATAGTRVLLLRVLHIDNVALHLVVGTAAGLAFAVAVQLVAMRLGIAGWLGLPRVAADYRPAARISTSMG
jgi:hypothetical protein